MKTFHTIFGLVCSCFVLAENSPGVLRCFAGWKIWKIWSLISRLFTPHPSFPRGSDLDLVFFFSSQKPLYCAATALQKLAQRCSVAGVISKVSISGSTRAGQGESRAGASSRLSWLSRLKREFCWMCGFSILSSAIELPPFQALLRPSCLEKNKKIIKRVCMRWIEG